MSNLKSNLAVCDLQVALLCLKTAKIAFTVEATDILGKE